MDALPSDPLARIEEPERRTTVPVGLLAELETAIFAMTCPLAMIGFCAKLRVVALVARLIVSAMGAAMEAA